MSKKILANFGQALLAVLAGNAVYFLMLPHLPMTAQHAPFRMDLGLLIDLWLCLVAFGVVKAVWAQNRSSERTKR